MDKQLVTNNLPQKAGITKSPDSGSSPASGGLLNVLSKSARNKKLFQYSEIKFGTIKISNPDSKLSSHNNKNYQIIARPTAQNIPQIFKVLNPELLIFARIIKP